jgi:hypothetical protein
MRPFAGLGFRLAASAVAVAAAVGFAPAVAAAQDFELHPAYIDGTIEFGDSVAITQSTVYAYAYDSSTGLTHNASTGVTLDAGGHSGTYHLTVEAGASGLTYSLYSYTYANNYQATIYTPQASVAVSEGATTTHDLSYPGYQFGTVHTTVDVTGAGTLQYAYVNFNSSDPGTGITTYSSVYIPAGAADALVGPGNVQAYGQVYALVNGSNTYYPLGYQYFSIAAGGSTDLGWTLDIDPVDPGSITGTIAIDGEYVDVFYIYAYGGNPPQSLYTQVYGGGSFTFDPANPGSWSLYANAYATTDDGGYTYYNFPYIYVNVLPGEDLTGVDFHLDPAYAEGTLALGDWRDPSSSSVYVQAYGANGAYTQYYKTYYSIDVDSTPYCLFLDANTSWQLSSAGVTNYYYDGTNNAYNSVSGYIANGAIPDLDEGDTYERDISVLDFNASTLTLHLTVAGGGTLSNPQVNAYGYYLDGDGNYVYSSNANASNYGQTNVTEGTVTLTLAPGTYDITASAYVNGSWTSFGVLNDYVVEPGDVIDQDLDAPVLVITSPAPASEFECHSDVTVSGVATDPSGVASVTVNGTSVDVDEDGNFETVLEHVATGTHTVEITAVDTLGNAVTIQRSFEVLECEDEDAPVITGSRSPAANEYGWNNTDVTVCFEATDESEIVFLTDCTTLSTDGAGQSVTGTATDEHGNSASTTVGNINIDKSAPSVSASPSSSCLWSPNHKMVPITISGSVSDLSGARTIQGFAITSNEKDDDNGDGRTAGDCNGKDGYTSPAVFTDSISVDSSGNFSFGIKLRAERQGNSQDRVYTIKFKVVDLAGNTTCKAVTVCVPHNQ